MTRINIIPPIELTDQHLIAEYREITMVPGSLRRTLNSKSGFRQERVSETYTLNAGHVYFFYDKGRYLNNRYAELVEEMKFRGFNPDPARRFPREVFPKELYNDWMPTVEEQKVVKQRIQEKINLRPNWYRHTKY